MRYVAKIFALANLLLGSLAADAQQYATRRFAFQGRLTGVSAGAHNMIFTFNGGSATGSTASQSVTVNSDGSFSAVIDDPAIVPGFFHNAALPTLSVNIDVDGGAHVFNNVPITSVPSAFVAAKALSLDISASIAPAQIAGPLVLAQVPSLDGSKITDGSLSSADLSSTGVTPGTYGSATQVPVFTVDAAGRISNVSNTTISGGAGTVTSITPGVGFTSGTPITGVGTLDIDVGTAPNKIVRLDATAKLPAVDGSLLTNLSTSQIAAGALPIARGGTGASVAGSAFTNLAVNGGTIGGPIILDSNTGTPSNPTLEFAGYSSNLGFYVPSTTNHLAYAVGGTEALRIDASGNVGIGTTSPMAPLHVIGKIYSSFGTGNMAVGTSTGNPSGTNNTLLGFGAGNTMGGGSGNNNTLVGESSGLALTTGSDNVLIGRNSGGATPLQTGGGNTVVGTGATVATNGTSNAVVMGKTSIANSDGTALGYGAVGNGTGSVALGSGASVGGSANYGIAIGMSATVSGTASGSIAIGQNASVSTANTMVLGGTSVTTVRPSSDGIASLGTGSNRWGSVYASNGTINTSDRRLKKDIRESELGLDFIQALRPVSYLWTDNTRDTRRHYGVIAQELEETLDGRSFGGLDYDKDADRYGVGYTELIAPMIKAMQEQQGQIEELKRQNAELKARLEKLETQ